MSGKVPSRLDHISGSCGRALFQRLLAQDNTAAYLITPPNLRKPRRFCRGLSRSPKLKGTYAKRRKFGATWTSGQPSSVNPSSPLPAALPLWTQILQTWRDQQHMSLSSMNLRRIQVCKTARFLLQTCLLCNLAPPSWHSLAFPAHRHRLSVVARKKMYALARREMSRRARSLEK